MYKFRHAGRDASKPAGLWWWPWVLLASAWLPLPAWSSCLDNPDPEIHQLQELIGEDAGKVLKQTRTLLAALRRAPVADLSHNASRIAAVYAVEAEAYGILELDADARGSAAKGLALATGEHDPIHLELLSAYADNVYDRAGIAGAIEAIEAARVLQPRGSLADTCLLITRGLLEHRQDREDLAIVTLTQAYRASIAPAVTETHIMSADYLSLVMRSMGDYSQALALNQEKIDWDTAHDATMSLSVSRFMRGQILKLMGNYNAAIVEFSQARKLSVSLDDMQGIAFADQRICEAHIELGRARRRRSANARARCAHSAFAQFGRCREGNSGPAGAHRFGFGQRRARARDLEQGARSQRYGHAAASCCFDVRMARAHRTPRLHNYHDAYNDLQEYVTRYKAANDAERNRQANAQRARFETDKEVERNASLQRELQLSQEQSSRQAQQLRWNTVVVVAGVLVIALLIYFLIANRRYRQQLVKLASQDSLTGLPNRRRTAELAAAALQEASETHKPLTIAIIDMDHFKVINDRCGHATGDYVLREFARAGREALRDPDILGRWGGEEFLLVMPDTPLEYRSGEPGAAAHAGVRYSAAGVRERTAGESQRGPCHQ